jgi:hypothetical protein
MIITFDNVKPQYEYMFTANKDYPVIRSHAVYGYLVLTDNAKECWLSEKFSEYGEKKLLN